MLFPPAAELKLTKPAFKEKESDLLLGTLPFLLSPRLPFELFFCLANWVFSETSKRRKFCYRAILWKKYKKLIIIQPFEISLFHMLKQKIKQLVTTQFCLACYYNSNGTRLDMHNFNFKIVHFTKYTTLVCRSQVMQSRFKIQQVHKSSIISNGNK